MTALTIHDDIENWLAAAVHDELSPSEKTAFDEHLAGCATCRQLHEEELAMSKLVENTLAADRPDFGFEQRVVSRFRKVVPRRVGFTAFLTNLLRTRATQLTAAAALLLALVQVGKFVAREPLSELPSPTFAETEAMKDNGDDRVSGQRKAAGGETSAARGVTAPPPVRAAEMESFSVASAARATTRPAAAMAKSERGASGNQSVTAAQDAPQFVKEEPAQATAAVPPDPNRKLVRNAQVELEVASFDEATLKISGFATEDRGYIATSSSEKQSNGKLRGEVVVKVLPEKLDAFLLKLRGLGELKNQTLGSEDVTKQYFDTASRMKSAQVMEQRLIEILKTNTGKVSDLLEVEKELGRVRSQIEEMQGSLKYMDAQVQFATVTVTLAEKDMNLPAAFLLKRTAQLALFSTEVEKTFAEAKAIVDGTKAQISSSTLDRDSSGEATARLVLLIAPEDADVLISRIKAIGRVQNYTEKTDRIAQGGSGMSGDAKVERDKVQLSITISRNEQEPALQTTSLRILTLAVAEKVEKLKEKASSAGAEIRSSSFSRNPDGQEVAFVTLRVPMKNYAALLASLDQLGKVKDLSVQRQDRRGVINEETAPADISIQVYSQGRFVSDETGLFATIRRTLGQGATALMWSLRMIGVALAFLAPWAIALGVVCWVLRRIGRARATRTRNNQGIE